MSQVKQRSASSNRAPVFKRRRTSIWVITCLTSRKVMSLQPNAREWVAIIAFYFTRPRKRSTGWWWKCSQTLALINTAIFMKRGCATRRKSRDAQHLMNRAEIAIYVDLRKWKEEKISCCRRKSWKFHAEIFACIASRCMVEEAARNQLSLRKFLRTCSRIVFTASHQLSINLQDAFSFHFPFNPTRSQNAKQSADY